MKVVLDYNIVFSALYNQGSAQELFVKNHVSRTFEFLVPAYFWEELKRLRGKLIQITRLSSEEIDFLLEKIEEQIITVDIGVYRDFLPEAQKTCPDPKDIPYVALAMATATPLLTGDKKLIESLGEKIKILTLNEAVRLV